MDFMVWFKYCDMCTDLYVACEYSHISIVKYLASIGGDVNMRTTRGFFPLYVASEFDRLEVVQFLVSNGARLNGTNYHFV